MVSAVVADPPEGVVLKFSVLADEIVSVLNVKSAMVADVDVNPFRNETELAAENVVALLN